MPRPVAGLAPGCGLAAATRAAGGRAALSCHREHPLDNAANSSLIAMQKRSSRRASSTCQCSQPLHHHWTRPLIGSALTSRMRPRGYSWLSRYPSTLAIAPETASCRVSPACSLPGVVTSSTKRQNRTLPSCESSRTTPATSTTILSGTPVMFHIPGLSDSRPRLVSGCDNRAVAASPRLSVVLVTDRYETVRRMVQSIAAQTRPEEVELVFVAPANAG